MIKRIIFDLDNTLISFEEEYWDTLEETFKYEKIYYTKDILIKTKNAIITYEEAYNIYNKKTMKDYIEKQVNIELTNTFIDTWIENLKKCVPEHINLKTIEVLDYLSKKYELVVLTNWFTEQQKSRLENANIAKYFKEVIGTDTVLNKPNKKAFIKACASYSPSECVMIGDNLKADIIKAKELGLNVIYLNINQEETIYPSIKELIELKEML